MRQVPIRKEKNLLYPIFWVSLFDQICITITFPLLTFICFDLNSRLFPIMTSHAERSLWYGVFCGIPHFVAIITAPILAILSDKLGRKKIMTIGACGAFAFSLFMVLGIIEGSVFLVLFGSVICGLCVRTEPIALAAVADCSRQESKIINMGLLQVFISIGAFIGPILCGYFAKRFFFRQLDFAVPCIIGLFFGFMTIVLTRVYFKETHSVSKDWIPRSSHGMTSGGPSRGMTEGFCRYFKSSAIGRISVVLILSQFGWRLYYQYISPILKTQLHFSDLYIGVFMGCIAFWLILGSSLVVRLFNKYTTVKKTLFFSISLMLFGLICVLLSRFVNNHLTLDLLIWLSAVGMAIGDVIVYCVICTLYSSHVSKNEQGNIMGVNFILVSVVWTLSGFLGGILEVVSDYLPIIVGFVFVFALLVFVSKGFDNKNSSLSFEQ